MKLNDSWVCAEGTNDNNIPYLLRFRTELQNFIDTENYNTRLDITWDYVSDKDNLLPSLVDLELMEKIEDALIEGWEGDFQTILTFVYTGVNERLWTWYTKDSGVALERLNNTLANFSKVPIRIAAENDPEWSEYIAVLENTED